MARTACFMNNSEGIYSCLANLLLSEKWRTCLSMVCINCETQRYIFLLHFCSASHFNPAGQNSSILKTHFWVILCVYSGINRTIHGIALAGLGAVILCEPILYAYSMKLLLTLDVFPESKIRRWFPLPTLTSASFCFSLVLARSPIGSSSNHSVRGKSCLQWKGFFSCLQ